MAVALVAAVALAASAAGCGGNGKSVGEVTKVHYKSVFVGPTQVRDGDSLSAKSFLSTDTSGSVDFRLDSGTRCRTERNSKLGIEPGGGIRLRFLLGRSLCWKGRDASNAKYRVGGDILITTVDPVFAVAVGEGQSVVQVTFGFVEVETEAAPEPVVVGPDQQAVVSSAQPAPRLEESELSPQAQKIADAMEERLPKPPAGPPSNLDQIAARGMLVLAVDRSVPASVQSFVEHFADLLGTAWAVDSRVELRAKDEAQRRLDEGDVDIVIAPSQAAPTSAAVPLFRRRGLTWVLAISPNSAFEQSLRDFITASLQTGDYGALYLDTFGSQPTYAREHGSFIVNLTQAALTPRALGFGQVEVGAFRTQSLTLTAGPKDLTVGRIRSDSTEFAVTNHCPGTLAGGKTCAIDVAFAPSSAGQSTATLTVSPPSGPPLAATLGGTGVPSPGPQLAPALVNFGQVDVDARMRQSLTLTAGLEDLTIGGISIDSTEFAATRDCPGTLAGGKSCTIDVAFAPASAGAKSAKLSIDIVNDQPRRAELRGIGVLPPTIEPSRVNFGRVVVGSSRRRSVGLSAGSEPLTIIKLWTRNPREFTASSRCPVQIARGTSCFIAVEFKPLRTHSRSVVLTISFSNRAPLRVRLSGTGLEAFAQLEPTSLDFGSVSYSPSASSRKTVTLTNAGSVSLTLREITSSDEQFSVDNNCPPSVAIGESCTFSVTFTPTTGGLQSAAVTIGAEGGGQDTLPVSGVGVIG